MKKTVLTAIILLLAAPVWAQMPAPVITKDPAKIPAGTYQVEPYHTRVLFAVNHFGLSTYYGEFTKIAGSLTLDPKKPAASSLQVTIAADSVTTPIEKLNGELKGADWLDVKKYPVIAFQTKKITVTGKDKAVITGELSLHGVTRPITLTARLNGGTVMMMTKKFNVGFELSGKFKRSDFGVDKYVPLVGDEITVIISAPFEKQG